MTVRGYFWRSSVRTTVKTVLEQHWEPTCHTREVPALPAGLSVLRDRQPDVRERTPRIVLSVVDKAEYERDQSKLAGITTRVCIGLMRQGFEVRNDTDAMRRTGLIGDKGPVDDVRLIGNVAEFIQEFGDPKKNGGPKK